MDPEEQQQPEETMSESPPPESEAAPEHPDTHPPTQEVEAEAETLIFDRNEPPSDETDGASPADEPAASDAATEAPAQDTLTDTEAMLPEEDEVEAPPLSAAPPRIVAETPVGGVLQTGPVFEAETAREESADEAPPERVEAVESPAPDSGATPAEIAIAAVGEEDASTTPAIEDESGAESIEARAEENAPPAEAPEEVETIPTAQEPSFVRTLETMPPAEPDTVAGERVESPQEWDDSLSPELAAVLFSSPRQEAIAEAEAAPVPEATERETPAPAIPALAETPRAAPAPLTDTDSARTLRITARGYSAPAPDTALSGKVRYTRLEEPLKDDAGQRVRERWVYFKPDYPALEGRLVREVRREEIHYRDGSWRWRYERRYADKGRDRREVRANADRTYIERVDEVSRLEPESGKRQQVKEEAAMIFAPPARVEKRGLLSSLLGRGNDAPSGEKTWREATPADQKQARKTGGQAFKRGFLAAIFG